MKKPRFNYEGREFFEFDLTDEQLSIMNRRATRNRRRNSKMITEACMHVGGDPSAPLLNKEYLANAEKIREINKANGHDRDANLAMFRKEHEEDELRMAKEYPITWKIEEPAPKPKPKSWFHRLYDWIESKQKAPPPDNKRWQDIYK